MEEQQTTMAPGATEEMTVNRLRGALAEHGLTVTALAREAEIPQQTVSAMLTGRLPRSSWRWERLQDALHDALAIKAAADAAADAKRQELRQARPLPRLRQL